MGAGPKRARERVAIVAPGVAAQNEEILRLDEQPGRAKKENFALRHWPAMAMLTIYWVTVAALVLQSMRVNEGHLIYPLDDTYIHMAMAKNASQNGVWGVTQYEFTSATSSPLWTAMLAGAFWVSGVHDVTPLIMNLALGSLLIAVAYAMLRRSGAKAWWTTCVLVATVFVAALPTVTVIGMEHTLHALVMLVFAAASAAVLASERPVPLGRALWLALLAGLVTSARYEGLFALAVIAMLLAARRKWMAAALVSVGGMLPPVAYGLWSLSHGWYAVPNSILLKGTVPTLTFAGVARLLSWWNGLTDLAASPYLLTAVAASLLAVAVLAARPKLDERVYLNVIFVAVALLHLEFTVTAWFFRYDAYLVVLGLVVLGVTAGRWSEPFRRRILSTRKPAIILCYAMLALIILTPSLVRAEKALHTTSGASHNIFEQQYQMGLFLEKYFPGRVIAANDIGAIDYLANVRLVDLYGLGTMEVARQKRAGVYTRARIEELARKRGVDVAIAYENWFGAYGGLPETWQKAGEWTVRENFVLGGSTVSFYAMNPAQRAVLASELKAFGAGLPADMKQTIVHTP